MPACAPSSAASSSRPRARPPSATGCSPPSIPSITTRCAGRAADKLKRLGLSAAKIKSIREIGKAIAKGHIDLTAVGNMDADAAHAALTALHGIGPWTADIYLLFCLGHADAFPAGDLAVQEAARIALGLAQAPGRKSAHEDRRGLAALARCGGASAVGLLSRGEEARRGAGSAGRRKSRRPRRRRKGKSGMAELDGPRIEPRSGRRKQLVVFLHGYGADGNDLIEIGRAWAGPVARRRLRVAACAAPLRAGADRARMVSADLPRSQRALDRRQRRRAGAQRASSMPNLRAAICRPRRSRWSAFRRAP